MSQVTELASGQITAAATIIELVEADETPAVVIVREIGHLPFVELLERNVA
jgi:hypothetical protein